LALNARARFCTVISNEFSLLSTLIFFYIVTDLLKRLLGKHCQSATMGDVSQWIKVISRG
jgi:hypothetical protein